MDKPYIAHIVAHTHWDREWYSPFQTFRMRLVRLLDRVIHLLDTSPDFKVFNLDGQVIPLLDYLEIRPEAEPRLRELIRSRRLLVGPWFLLPDEFLTSGEALVRNLLSGQRIANDYGHVMASGYIPDTFGHNSQLPQILQGFGLDTTYWWRGLSGDEYRSEIWWESPDGSRVLLNKLPEYCGYSNACALYADPSSAAEELENIVRTEMERATTRHILIMIGTDHLEPRDDLPQLIAMANERSKIAKYVFSSLEDYALAVLEEVNPKGLTVTTGEKRDTSRAAIGGGFILPNVLSARIYIKQQNESAQTALERWAEPYSALLTLLGRPYPRRYLDLSWQWLLQNQSHDCICGTSVDAVHDQMETRFQWSQEIADTLVDEHFDWLGSQVDTAGLQDGEVGLLLFNGLAWERNEAVTVAVDLPLSELVPLSPPGDAIEDYTGHHSLVFQRHSEYLWKNFQAYPETVRGLRLRDLVSGETLPVQIEEAGFSYVTRNLRHGPMALERTYRVRIAFEARGMPAYGYRLYAASLTPLPNKHKQRVLPTNVLENQFLRAEIQPNGSIDLIDKMNDQFYPGLAFFEDGGDAGDSYNYSYPLYDQVINTLSASPRISRLGSGLAIQRYQIEYELALPVGLDEGRRARRPELITCPLRVVVSLGAHASRLEFSAGFENNARDHRLRVVFPSGIRSEFSYSDTPFDIVAHATSPQAVPVENWIEDVPSQHPQQTFIDLHDGKRGLAVLSVALPEYEVVKDSNGEIKVTLLRAVKFLGGGSELQTIRGGAGPNIETPGAQVQRSLHFRLAVFPHSDSWSEAEVWREAQSFAVPVKPRTISSFSRPISSSIERLPAQLFLLRVRGKNIVLSAVKRAEDDDNALVVRVYNPDRIAQSGRLEFFLPPISAEVTRLDETPLEPVTILLTIMPDGSVPLELPPRRILTLKLRWNMALGEST